jgi:hypothetical protein
VYVGEVIYVGSIPGMEIIELLEYAGCREMIEFDRTVHVCFQHIIKQKFA